MNILEKILKEHRSERSLLRRLAYAPFRPSGVEFQLVDYMGARFLILANEDLGWRMVSQDRYEENELRTVRGLIEPQDLCIDVGANLGIYAVLMGHAVPDGEVLAFEPLPLNRAILSFNVTLNQVDNVDIRSEALSNREGTAEMSVPEDGGYASLRPTDRKALDGTREVPTTRLDDALGDAQGRVGVLKIDVEGAEALVLEGASSLLDDPDRRPRGILVEMSDANQAAFDTSPTSIARHLEGFGYSAHSFQKGGGLLPGVSTQHTENVLFIAPDQEPPSRSPA